LDSGVYFLGSAQGPDCSPKNATYLHARGDARGCNGGVENYLIYLGKAFADQKWNGSTTVLLAAGWTNLPQGLAVINMSTWRYLANGTVFWDNNQISFYIEPAKRPTGQCSLQIAVANVVRGTDGKVTVTVQA
jgi:hypothetical protein